MSPETRNQHLRRVLREGDPAALDPGLSPEEAQALRRALLRAVPERKRSLLPLFAAVGATLAAALVALAVLLPRPEVPEPPSEPRIARATPPPVPSPPPLQEEPQPIASKTSPAPRPPRAPVPAPEPEEPREEPLTLASAEPRQIQFSTPGGTRIVWVLTPGDATFQGD